MSSNTPYQPTYPDAPPQQQQQGYQIGAGAPLNQQYLQSQQTSSTPPQQQQQQQQHGSAATYAPPPAPAYTPGASDLATSTPQQQQQQQHDYTGSSDLKGQYPPPPVVGGSGAPTAYPTPPQQYDGGSAGMPGQHPQQYPAPPQQYYNGNAGMPGQHPQQYPAPPQQYNGGSAGMPGQNPQQYPHPHQSYDGAAGMSGALQQYPPPPPQNSNLGAPSSSSQTLQQYPSQAGAFAPPPKRQSVNFGDDDPSNPIHYTRDPHKLVAYLVPFPKPQIKGVDMATIPDRFLIYTPPPPPLSRPAEGEKEDKLHKVQRKWQEEVRAAKTSDAKTASWKGVKSKATKGISYVMSKTTSSNLDFVNRIPGAKADPKDKHSDDGIQEGDTTHKTVGLEEMVLVYPSSYPASPDQVRTEFVNTMMRTKSKAQRDAIISTGLLPVAGAIDVLATLVWPFGGLLEIDGVWAYSSIRGAKTARSVTKRLSSTTASGTTHPESSDQEIQSEEKLRLNFTQSPRLEVLHRYLLGRCRDYDHKLFPSTVVVPTETDVLSAIGWAPSQNMGAEGKNWEDEQWETEEVKGDMKSTLSKAAREWDKWCKAFEKNPEKALRK